jgi:hypothetical protein
MHCLTLLSVVKSTSSLRQLDPFMADMLVHSWLSGYFPGVPFENGISLTKKNVGDSDWDWDAESWIP